MQYELNGQWVDLSIKALDSMEIGCIIQFMGNTIPTGWLECDGSSITQSDYPELYALIGGTLPNFKGRVLVGQDTNDSDFDTLGETGGSKQLQEHRHQMYFGYTYDYTSIVGGGGAGLANWRAGTSTGTTDLYTQNTGSGNSGNLQPYAVVKHIIKALNTTPTMASIVNGYSTSTQDGYSCDYLNDRKKILYDSNSGTSGNITLSESINNFDEIEIFWYFYDGNPKSCKYKVKDIQNAGGLNLDWCSEKTIFTKKYSVSGTSITKDSFGYYVINTGETASWDVCKVTRVTGYR